MKVYKISAYLATAETDTLLGEYLGLWGDKIVYRALDGTVDVTGYHTVRLVKDASEAVS